MTTERPDPPPYPASWVDRLHARIDRLPVPAWAIYLGTWLVLTLIANVVPWIEGVYPVGTFDLYVNSGPLSLVFGYAAIHYLDRAALRAWSAFRPATAIDDGAAHRHAFELTTVPARAVLAWTGLLRGISEVHRYVASVDLLRPRPLNAFAGLNQPTSSGRTARSSRHRSR